ncbi:MAG: protein-L-isoaspartate(D-aspartate) O-methyltransferase [Blastocatellia bacterium]
MTNDGLRNGSYDQAHARARMVARLRAECGVRDEKVLEAMNFIPRHWFIPEALRGNAYGDHPLPIGHGQTISQPCIVARQTELLEIGPGDRVLEIGAGCGYQTAVLSQLARAVFAVERILELANAAHETLTRLRIRNVTVKCFDGTAGWPDYAPYQGILVAAGGPLVPQPLVDQLAVGGRLIIPIGDEHGQRLTRVTRTERETRAEDFGPCQFVPLIGEHGWKEKE